MADHTLPITFEIPTETVLPTGQVIIINVGLVFALQETPNGSKAAVPEICYASNMLTGKKVPVPSIIGLFGPARVLELVQCLLWVAYFDDDFDQEQKEYLDTYVLPFMVD